MTYSEETIMSKAKPKTNTNTQVSNRNSLIDVAITDLIETGSPSARLIAYDVQQQDQDNAVLRIYSSYLSARNARNNNDVLDFKPEAVNAFIQKVSNQIVKKAKALIQSANRQEVFEEIAGGTGQDHYAELCESFGIEVVSRDKIQEIVSMDFDNLNQVHSEIRTQCSEYLPDMDRLYLYGLKSKNEETGEWGFTHAIDDLDEAIDTLSKIAEQIKADESADLLSKMAKLVA